MKTMSNMVDREPIGMPKADRLDNAINRVRGVISHAEELRSRICGVAHPEVPREKLDSKVVEVTLQGVLDEGPERLFMYCDDLHSIIDDITERLF